MNKKCEVFLNYFDVLVNNSGEPMPDEVKEFYDILKTQQGTPSDKPVLTESGAQILAYLQSCNAKNLKAKDIADSLGVSSRKVSGSMRKLVTDNFVEKFGNSPVVYTLTEKGRTFNIAQYDKENS